MDPAELYRIQHRKPFQPFRVHLKDGRTYDITCEEMAVVGRWYYQIGVPAPDLPDLIFDHADTIDLSDIDRLEPLVLQSSP